MPKEDEDLIQKLTGMLIQVLHGEYTDTRELAVVQLVLLGDKCVPYVCSYLEREAEMENDLITHHKLHIEHHRNEGDREATRVLNQFREVFQRKWGWQAQDEYVEERACHGGNRRN